MRFRFTVCLFLILSLVVPVGLARQEDDGVIRIETDLVVVNATVTDAAGLAIANLQKKDFILEEDGQPRQIAVFAAEDAPFAAAILIDASGSMKTKLARARVAASQFIEKMREGDSAAVYGFNNSVEQLQDFSSYKEIAPDLFEIEAKGLTKLYDCLYEALTALEKRSEQRRAVILISDGDDSNSEHSDSQVLDYALKIGATVYSVDIAEANRGASAVRGVGVLKNLSEKTGGQYIKTPGGQQLNEKLLEVSKELRSQYTIGFYPEKRTKGKWRKLTVKVISRQDARVRARQGYKA